MINVIDRDIKMQEKYILILDLRTVFNSLSDNNKIDFRKLLKKINIYRIGSEI